VRGKGMRVNGKPAHASMASVEDAVVLFDAGGGPYGGVAFDAWHHVGPEVLHTRLLGSAALTLAYAGAGRVDFFVFTGIKGAWDIAAGIIQVQEGGGVVTNHSGGQISIFSPGILAGSPVAHADFLERVKDEPWYNV
jgi:myo-inositol-1(or 4)-monophosphatase